MGFPLGDGSGIGLVDGPVEGASVVPGLAEGVTVENCSIGAEEGLWAGSFVRGEMAGEMVGEAV